MPSIKKVKDIKIQGYQNDDMVWNHMFKELLKHRERNGDGTIPQLVYMVPWPEGKNRDLGKWLRCQQRSYKLKTMPKERYLKFKELEVFKNKHR